MQLKYIPDSFSNLTPVKYLHLFFQSPGTGRYIWIRGAEGVSEVYREEGWGVGDQTVRARPPPCLDCGGFCGELIAEEDFDG